MKEYCARIANPTIAVRDFKSRTVGDITGIKMYNANGSELSENFIQGFITSGNIMDVPVFNARPAYGMDINKSSAMKISCNDIRNVRYGMQIVSDCNTGNDENYSGNRFHNHNFPIIFRHLGNEGAFGNIGNGGFDCSNDFVYTPPLGTPGGVFNNNNWKVTRMSSSSAISLDYIYTAPGLLDLPESGGNNLSTYYIPADNTGANVPNQCITNNPFSQNGSEVGMDIDYAMMVAGDSIIYPEYADVSRWFDERRLFELLASDSILRNSYYYFLDFYNAQLLLPTDEILQVDRLINDLMAANITDSADFTNRIAAIENLNNTILSGRGFENNERVINTYFIKWLTGGISSFTETEKEEIEAMAMSCPFVNGTAVYKARTIYASINPGIDYNDLTICNAAGVYKNGGGKGLFDDENTLLNNMISGNGNTTINHVNKFTNKAGVKLYPNPASNNITIDYKLNANETAVLIIYDVIGRERLKFDLQSNVNKVDVKINSLEPGVYSYKYSVNNIQNSTGKLIIE